MIFVLKMQQNLERFFKIFLELFAGLVKN